MGSIVVSCKNVTKTYHSEGGDTPALRGIDLDVTAGELLMLVGPSGCGKTTLISILAGILTRDSGACTVLGTDFDKMRDGERTRFRGKNIGFVFQAFNLIPTLTVQENVAVPLLIHERPRAEALEIAAQSLDRVGLKGKERVFPRSLSGGQQQRVAIARALIHQPSIVVCDEPTSALDAVTGHRVMELLRGTIDGTGRALIIVTHDSRVFSFADRIARMDDGRIVEIGKELSH